MRVYTRVGRRSGVAVGPVGGLFLILLVIAGIGMLAELLLYIAAGVGVLFLVVLVFKGLGALTSRGRGTDVERPGRRSVSRKTQRRLDAIPSPPRSPKYDQYHGVGTARPRPDQRT